MPGEDAGDSLDGLEPEVAKYERIAAKKIDEIRAAIKARGYQGSDDA